MKYLKNYKAKGKLSDILSAFKSYYFLVFMLMNRMVRLGFKYK